MASRFWVGGTGTWDASDTTHWSATTGGGGGQSVPGSADTVTFDGSSGGGTVTVNTTVTVQSVTCGAFTGTLDFSANNNNVTLSASAGFNGSGSGTRTINLGNGTWTISGTGAAITPWNMSSTTGLTFNANSSTISFTGTNASTRTISDGSLTYSTISIAANTGGGATVFSGSPTIATLNITAPNAVSFGGGTTTTITNAFNWTGSSSAQLDIRSSSAATAATVNVASGSPTMSWAGVHKMTFAGGATYTATNSFDLGANSGITITAPNVDGGPIAKLVSFQRGTPY